MRTLIYEYFAAGAGKDDGDLVPLGFAMLNALLADFMLLPELEIHTILHPRLRATLAQIPYADRIKITWSGYSNNNWLAQLEEKMELCESVLLIAPETEGLLAQLIALAESKGKKILGSSARAVGLVSNKAATINLLKKHSLPVPKTEVWTWPLPAQWAEEIYERFTLPIVLKPVYGTGGQGVVLIKEPAQLVKSLQQLEEAVNGKPFLVQEYINGEAVSVSCLVAGGKVLPLSLNRQIVAQEGQFLFQGITVPYWHPQVREAFRVVTKACELVEGLAGFVGVDLVLRQDGPVIMEINSRVTVAYVALRKVLKRNLALDLWQSCLEHRLPAPPEFSGTFTYLSG